MKETGAFADKLYTVESFKREFSGVALPDVVLSDLDLKVLLKHLERDMKIVVSYQNPYLTAACQSRVS